MTGSFDPLARDPLARRLSRLAIQVPARPTLMRPGVRLQPSRRRAGWRIPAASTAGLAALALTVTAFAYPGGLGALTQDALRAAGLTSVDQITAVTGSAEKAGVKVEVDGGYADRLSTVLFVAITPACQGANCTSGVTGAPYVVDASGRRYVITGGEGIGVGPYPMFFQPLSQSARLTLHVPIYTAPRGQSLDEVVVPIAGTLTPATATQLTPPAPVVDTQKEITYAVTGLVASGNYLEVHSRLSGRLDNVIVHYGPSGAFSSGESWPGVYLVDAAGRWHVDLAGDGQPPAVDQTVQDETRIFAAQPGTYRLVVATSGKQDAPGPDWTVLAGWTVTIPR